MGNVVISITSKATGVTQTFDAIAHGADTTAAHLEQASARGAASFEKMGNVIGKAGLAFGAFSLLAGKAAGDSDASAARLQTSFQNAGLAVQDYQDQINRLDSKGLHLAFDDEDVNDALARLVGVTKDVGQAFNDLQLAEDIARGTGESLAAASETVAQVEAGRYRGLAALGIVLDSTATKQDYLAAAQKKYSGEAAAYATTGAANFDRWKNSAENALESVGGHLAGLQTPILALSTTAAALGPLGKALKELSPSMKEGEAATGLLSSAVGPVGLGLALGGAALAFALLSDRTAEWEDAAKSAAGVTVTLDDAIYRLAAGGQTSAAGALKGVEQSWDALAKSGAEVEQQIADIDHQISLLTSQKEASQPPLSLAEQDALTAQIDGLKAYAEQLKVLSLSSDDINKITAAIDDLFIKPGIDAKQAAHDIQYYFDLFNQGQIDQATLVEYIVRSDTEWTKYSSTLVVTSDAQALLNTQMETALGIMNEMTRPLTQIPAMEREIAAAANEASMALLGQQSAAEAATANDFSTWAGGLETSFYSAITSTNKWSADTAIAYDAVKAAGRSQADGAVAGFAEIAAAAKASTDMVGVALDAEHQRIDGVTSALAGYAQQLGQTAAIASTHAATFAQHATTATDALSAGFRVAVGNTNQMGSQSQAVADWGAKLINVKGQLGEIDTLLAKGVITQQEYNRAQSSETSIFHENADIQRDIMKIQTDQAPVIARLTKEQAEYMDHLASLPAQQQLVRLGYMDSAESAKALSIEQLAAAAAAGELGKAGEENATKMITAAAEADPVLRGMLEDMGIIKEGADGTISVDFSAVSGAKDEMKTLLDHIDTLVEEIGQVFGIDVDHGSVDAARDSTFQLNSYLDQLQDRHITYSVATVYTNVGSAGAGVGSDNEGIGGTPYVPPVPAGGGTGDNPFGNPTGAYLGGVVGYAAGGAVRAELAEYGPEMVRLAGGGSAMAWHRGLYDVPRGSYVSTAPATRALEPMVPQVVINFNGGTFLGTKEEFAEYLMTEMSKAIVVAAEQHYRGHGIR